MVLLIRDLDNPFDYEDKDNASDEIALTPLIALKTRLGEDLKINN